MRVVERLGSLQFDPLEVAGRNHDLVLLARIAGYRRQWCGFQGFWPPCFARIGHPVSPETATLFHG